MAKPAAKTKPNKPVTPKVTVKDSNVTLVSDFPDPEISLVALAQVLVGQQSNRRRATAHIKHRGDVAGTTKKPWRQKGTGRARVGTRRNPVWRGGGVVFGPTNQRNFSKKINQQLIVPALLAVLASKARRGEVVEIKSVPMDSTKTKLWLEVLSEALDSKSNLLVMAESNLAIRKAVRNISYIQLTTARELNALTVAAARKIILLPQALTVLQERIGK
jgi:large subunit ribosomal protein L4